MKTNILLIISCLILLSMSYVLDKSCRENQNMHFMFSNFFRRSFRFRDKVEKYCRAGQATDNITRRMRIAYRIPKATNTCSEYVIFILYPLE